MEIGVDGVGIGHGAAAAAESVEVGDGGPVGEVAGPQVGADGNGFVAVDGDHGDALVFGGGDGQGQEVAPGDMALDREHGQDDGRLGG